MLTNNEKHKNEIRSNFKHYRDASAKKVADQKKQTEVAEELNEEQEPQFQTLQDLLNDSEAADDGELSEMLCRPLSEIEVVKAYIQNSYDSIRTNKLTKKIELTILDEKKELTDRTVNGWLDHLWSYETYTAVDGRNGKETIKKVCIDKNKLYTLIENDAFAPFYDPIDEYFMGVASLAEGITAMPETEKFISCFTCDNEAEIVQLYFKAWLAGVFTNYYSDHDKFDQILILQSKQGSGKTTAIEHHLLKPFRDYVVKNFDWSTSNKDEMIKLATSLFIFDDELSATKKSVVEDLKTITSLKSINNIRPVYGRTSENYIRRASFIGATNNTNIISDVTGSRRFLILGITSIDLKGIAEINFDLLWSEAYNYFHVQHNKVWVDFDKIEANNQQYKFISAEEEYLERHFDFTKEGNTWFTTTEVLDLLRNREPSLVTNVTRISNVLTSKGYKSKSKRIDGSVLKRYHLHQIGVTPSSSRSQCTAQGDAQAETSFDFDDLFAVEKSAVA